VLRKVSGAAHGQRSSVKYRGVDHRCCYFAVPESFLNSAYISTAYPWVGGLTWLKASVAELLRMAEKSSWGPGDGDVHGAPPPDDTAASLRVATTTSCADL